MLVMCWSHLNPVTLVAVVGLQLVWLNVTVNSVTYVGDDDCDTGCCCVEYWGVTVSGCARALSVVLSCVCVCMCAWWFPAVSHRCMCLFCYIVTGCSMQLCFDKSLQLCTHCIFWWSLSERCITLEESAEYVSKLRLHNLIIWQIT